MKEYIASLIAAAVSVIGSWGVAYITAQSAISEANVEMTKLAVGILQDENSSSTMKGWAIRLLGEYTDVPLTANEREDIIEQVDERPSDPKSWETINLPKFQSILRELEADGRVDWSTPLTQNENNKSKNVPSSDFSPNPGTDKPSFPAPESAVDPKFQTLPAD